MNITSSCKLLAVVCLPTIVCSAFVSGLAAADPPPAGCSSDYAVPNQLTITCEPGAGVGQHAYIRCRDIGGVLHTRIGTTVGANGGWSRAVCATGEYGPV
ncbi:hypothetical protein [Nocardia suismassiliense]|uniref:hypothetical protein n=1 Tax=Nocardia suismassiliense TaxID=2077092 RepID=UPI00131F1587|nr:hypothetical protein [Nocardia suismassiliense]